MNVCGDYEVQHDMPRYMYSTLFLAFLATKYFHFQSSKQFKYATAHS